MRAREKTRGEERGDEETGERASGQSRGDGRRLPGILCRPCRSGAPPARHRGDTASSPIPGCSAGTRASLRAARRRSSAPPSRDRCGERRETSLIFNAWRTRPGRDLRLAARALRRKHRHQFSSVAPTGTSPRKSSATTPTTPTPARPLFSAPISTQARRPVKTRLTHRFSSQVPGNLSVFSFRCINGEPSLQVKYDRVIHQKRAGGPLGDRRGPRGAQCFPSQANTPAYCAHCTVFIDQITISEISKRRALMGSRIECR